MRVEALVVLTDTALEGAPVMSILVEADVERGHDLLSGVDAHQAGPWRAIAAVWGVVQGLERGEGGAELIAWGQDLLDVKANAWRVMEALVGAYEAQAGKETPK